MAVFACVPVCAFSFWFANNSAVSRKFMQDSNHSGKAKFLARWSCRESEFPGWNLLCWSLQPKACKLAHIWIGRQKHVEFYSSQVKFQWKLTLRSSHASQHLSDTQLQPKNSTIFELVTSYFRVLTALGGRPHCAQISDKMCQNRKLVVVFSKNGRWFGRKMQKTTPNVAEARNFLSRVFHKNSTVCWS
jgi:hypothetical protein